MTERLARYLDTSIEKPIRSGISIELTLTQAQLAARLGTVREPVARAFAQREGSGMIRDPARLAALARGDDAAMRREDHVT